MNKLEQMHLEAIEKSEVNINPSDDDNMWITDKNVAAKKSAEITEQIAVEFVNWLWREIPEQAMAQESWKHWWNEWLKTKQ